MESRRIEEFKAACSDLVAEVEQLRKKIKAQQEIIEAAEYFIMNDRSWFGANQLSDAVAVYHSEFKK